eukprot:3052681-Rhodomonas_salina.2
MIAHASGTSSENDCWYHATLVYRKCVFFYLISHLVVVQPGGSLRVIASAVHLRYVTAGHRIARALADTGFETRRQYRALHHVRVS